MGWTHFGSTRGTPCSTAATQRKEGTATVTWGEYEALRDHLSLQLNNQCDKIQGDLAATDTKLETVLQTANDSAAQLTTIQASLATLTRAMEGMAQRRENELRLSRFHRHWKALGELR